MKKSVQISVLVITIVVTLFVFAGMWFLRPGVPNEILEEAKARQMQPLMEVTPPQRSVRVEQTTRTDAQLAKDLLPTLQQELEPLLKASITKDLKQDVQFIQALSQALRPGLLEQVRSEMSAEFTQTKQTFNALLNAELASIRQERAAYIAEIEAREKALQDEIALLRAEGLSELTKIDDSIAALRVEGLSEIYLIEDSLMQIRSEGLLLYTDAQEQIAEAKAEVMAYVPQVVDSMVEQVSEQVVRQIEANKEQYIAYLLQTLPLGLQEQEVLAMYEAYRLELVKDLVPAMLDTMEEELRREVLAYLDALPFVIVPPAPKAPIAIVRVLTEEPSIPVEVKTEPVVQPSVVVEPEPIVAPIPKVVSEPVVQPVMVEEPEVAAPPARKEGLPIISVPVFEEKTTVQFMDPQEYEEQRQDIRNKAIEDVLRRISQ